MPYKLPTAAITNSFETLPEDLKKIAEEMMAEKFGVKEEVVQRKAADFRTDYVPNGSYMGAAGGYGPQGYDYRPGLGIPADDTAAAFQLIKRNMRQSMDYQSNRIRYNSEVRMIYMNTSQRLFFVLDVLIDNTSIPYGQGITGMAESQLMSQYLSKIAQYPRGSLYLDM